jgi:hypothetical protein
MAWPDHGKLWSSCACHVLPVLVPCPCKVLAKHLHYCQALATCLPCVVAIARNDICMSCTCQGHVENTATIAWPYIVMLLPRSCRALAMPPAMALPCSCLLFALLLPCYCHVLAKAKALQAHVTRMANVMARSWHVHCKSMRKACLVLPYSCQGECMARAWPIPGPQGPRHMPLDKFVRLCLCPCPCHNKCPCPRPTVVS